MLSGAEDGFRDVHAVTLVLDGVDRSTGRDLAEDRKLSRVVGGGERRADAFHDCGFERAPALDRAAGRRLLGHLHHLQRPGAVGEAAKEAPFFQGGDQSMDAGLRRQIERLLHLIEGRRDSGLLDPFMDEHQQFVLLTRQHRRLAEKSDQPEQTQN